MQAISDSIGRKSEKFTALIPELKYMNLFFSPIPTHLFYFPLKLHIEQQYSSVKLPISEIHARMPYSYFPSPSSKSFMKLVSRL